MSVISALGKLRQGNHLEYKASLDTTVSSRQAKLHSET